MNLSIRTSAEAKAAAATELPSVKHAKALDPAEAGPIDRGGRGISGISGVRHVDSPWDRAWPPSIVAVFQPLKLVGDRTVDVGPPKHIDVTDLVLKTPATALRALCDNHASSDALVPYSRHWHDGLYRVEVVQSICNHFGVSELSQLNSEMIEADKLSRRLFASALVASREVSDFQNNNDKDNGLPGVSLRGIQRDAEASRMRP